MPRARRFVALLALSLLTTAAGANLAAAAQIFHVNLVDKIDGGMALKTATNSVKAGKVTFEVTNKSKDVTHEFLIAPLKVAVSNLPYDDSKGILKESKLPGVEELGDLAPGKSGSMTMNLKSGKYLLFCNLPGHFKSGMYHVLKVR